MPSSSLAILSLRIRTLSNVFCWVLGIGLAAWLIKPATVSATDYHPALFPHDFTSLLSVRFLSLFLRTFWSVLGTNLTVALIVSIGGLLTGGFLTLLTFVWNGFLIGTIWQQHVLGPSITLKEAVVIFAHAPCELVALVGFGNLGLLGFSLYRGLLRDATPAYWQQLRRACWQLRGYMRLGYILLIAAFVESFLLAWHLT